MSNKPEQPIRCGAALKKYNLSKSNVYRKFEDGTLTRYKFGGATFLDEREIINSMKPAVAA